MGALQPKNLRHLPFGGSAASGTAHIIGANGSSFLSGGANDRYVPDMTDTAVVVTWEVINTDGSNNLRVRFGPSSSAFTAAAGQVLDNYVTLKPGQAYNFPVFDRSQQINDVKGGPDYSIMLVEGDGGTCSYSGMATVWDPNDE